MSLLTATNGNVTLSAGGLSAVPNGAFTAAVVFRRSGATTDGYENLMALETAAGQVITNMGTDATTSPYALSFSQGGSTRTFASMTDLVDGDAYLFVVRKTSGTVAPRGNLYRLSAGSPAWDGWADASGTVENRSDTIGRARLLNQQGGFPLNGGIWVGAWWNVALAEADIVHASNGLHIGVQKWLDINGGVGLVELWRPGETDPVVSEAPSGTSDETASSGVTITAGDPPGFDMQFGAPAETITLTGSVPAPGGSVGLAAEAQLALAGSVPAPTGSVVLAPLGQLALAGSVPAPSGALSLAAEAQLALAGSVPAPGGSIVLATVERLALAGSVPAPDGAIVMQVGASVRGPRSVMLDARAARVRVEAAEQRVTISSQAVRVDA